MLDVARLQISAEETAIVVAILAARLPDRPVWAFGSRTNGKARRLSDLDLAVGGSQPLTLHERALLSEDFDASDLPFRVDVVDLNAITADFKQRIERDFVLVHAGSPKAAEEVLS